MIRNSQDFIIELDKIVRTKNTNYLEAMMVYIEKYNVDPELVASIVRKNAGLKAKLAEDCIKLRLLEKPKTT